MIRVVVCVDEAGGLYFNGRRQSRDRVMISDLIKTVGDERIYISDYSLPLFKGYEDNVKVCNTPLSECPDGGICFIELTQIGEYMVRVGEIIIYNWGEKYPADKRLDFSPKNSRMSLVSEYSFEGSSHKKITKGVYK